MATLYEIDEAIMGCVDMETGEIIDTEKLEQLRLARDEKLESVALWMKNLKADISAYKDEEQVFASKRKAAENRLEGLKGYLAGALNGESFKTSKVSVGYRRSTKVIIDDVDGLPEVYKTYEPKVDKTAVKKILSAGGAIDGAHLEENQSIQVR